MRILIVDDEPSLLFALHDYLTADGFEVECAIDVTEAQERLSRIEFDVVITDIRLSAKRSAEGLRVVSFIRERGLRSRVIVLTAHPGAEIEKEAERLGVDLFMRKPASLPQLARTLRGFSKKGAVMTRKKILLVDDSKTILMMERMILSKWPFDLLMAMNGEEAIAMARAERPDLILMDVVMPKMNGFDAVRAIREDDDIKMTPIIMVTTRGEGENVETGYESGCNDYVTKPINTTELLAKLRNYLGQE